MSDIGKRKYVHYTRIKLITLEEAAILLARFELQNEHIADTAEYDKLLKDEIVLATKVVKDAFGHYDIKCFLIGDDAYVYEDSDYIVDYRLNQILISLSEFCTWAHGLNYNLPEVLLQKYIKNPIKLEAEAIQESPVIVEAPKQILPIYKNKGGKPKGYLSEAVEQVFQKLSEHGKSDLSKPSKIREFIIFIKEMATQNSRYFDEYVKERIRSVQIPEEGDCTITTEDHVAIKGQNETILRGKTYKNNDVAKILTRLRKNNYISG